MTVNDMMKTVYHPPLHWHIKIVPFNDINSDGEWVNCGIHDLRDKRTFVDQAIALSAYAPEGYFIAAVKTS